jgi:hypothetical protein
MAYYSAWLVCLVAVTTARKNDAQGGTSSFDVQQLGSSDRGGNGHGSGQTEGQEKYAALGSLRVGTMHPKPT